MKVLVRKRVLIVLFLIIVSNIIYGKVIELKGQGKLTISDSLKYSYPKFNDSNWKKVSFPNDLTNYKKIKNQLVDSVFWYRIKIKNVKKILNGKPAAIMFTGISEYYKVFFNGYELTNGRVYLHSNKVYVIDSNKINLQKSNILAIKVTRKSKYSPAGIYNSVYFGDVQSVIGLSNKTDSLLYSLTAVLIFISLIVFLTFIKNTKNYSPLFLSSLLFVAAIYILFKSSVKVKIFSDITLYIKVTLFLEYLIIPLFVLYFLSFYSISSTKWILAYIGGLSIGVFFTLFARDIFVQKYIRLGNIIISIVPAAFLLKMLFLKMLKKKINAYFFFISIVVICVFSPTLFLLEKNYIYFNIFFISFPILLIAFGYMLTYVSNYLNLIESKYILDEKFFESNISVETKNEEFFKIEETNKYLEGMLNNDKDLTIKIHEKLKKEYPEINGVEYSYKVYSNKSFSSDFFDVVPLKEGARFVVKDFPGGEISSTLFSLVDKIELNNVSKIKSASSYLNKLNNIYTGYNLNSYFTAVVLDVFPEKGKIVLANSGFPDSILIRNNEIQTLNVQGAPIGLFEEKYNEDKINIQKDDEIILFTDGIYHQLTFMNKSYASFISEQKPNEILPSLIDLAEKNKNELIDDILIASIKIK